ncbi:MAG: hypothetical protein OXD49_11545 [Candidatus Poribacteria bacterium]|nr:hypothetical protein [Candidatus Poribacteria bacterium]
MPLCFKFAKKSIFFYCGREDAPLRETIEVRLLALFDEDTDREVRKARFQAEVPEIYADGTVSAWIDNNQ